MINSKFKIQNLARKLGSIFALFFLIAFVVIPYLSKPAYGQQQWNITKITPTPIDLSVVDTEVKFTNSGFVAWVRAIVVQEPPPGTQVQVLMVYDGTSTFQVFPTDASVSLFQNEFDINNSGTIAYIVTDKSGPIPCRELHVSTYPYDNNTTITDCVNNIFDFTVEINDNGDVFFIRDLRKALTFNAANPSNITEIFSGTEDITFLEVSGQYAAWAGVDNLYLFNGASVNHLFKAGIAVRGGDAIQVSSSGVVVFDTFDSITGDIKLFTFDGINTTTIVTTIASDFRINSAGQIVWHGPNNETRDVFLYDNGIITQVTTNPFSDFRAEINDVGDIIWVAMNNTAQFNSIGNIFFRDHTDGVVHQVTNFPQFFSARFPRLNNGGDIAYASFPGSGLENQQEIFIARLNQLPTANAGQDQDISLGNSVSLDGSGSTDPNGVGDIVSYAWDFGDNTSASGISVNHTYTNAGIYTASLIVTDSVGATNTDSATITVVRQLISLTPTQVWIGLKNSDDVGIKFDLLAEAYKDSTLISSGQLDSVPGGSSGFNNANLQTINFNSFSPIDFPSGSTLSIKVYARNACVGSGKNSGGARLWYNDSAANSSFGTTIAGTQNSRYLVENFGLSTSPGTGLKQKVDVAAGAKCSPFKLFGTWSVNL